jgi:hypothetical protein
VQLEDKEELTQVAVAVLAVMVLHSLSLTQQPQRLYISMWVTTVVLVEAVRKMDLGVKLEHHLGLVNTPVEPVVDLVE